MGETLRLDDSSVSVVIPAYRAAAFLEAAVASVRAQTVTPREIIVVDDCSPDDTAAVARRLGVSLLTTPSNGGAARARNMGIERASGTWIAFLDADDQWHPRHLELALEALRETGAILSTSRTRIADEFPPIEAPVKFSFLSGAALLVRMLGRNPVAQTACVVRRDVLQRQGGYRDGERYSEDYELWLRLATEGGFVKVEAVTCLYRVHNGQTSRASVPMFAKAWEHRLAAYERWGRDFSAQNPGFEEEMRKSLESALSVDLTSVWYEVDSDARDYFERLASETPLLRDSWTREVAARDSWMFAKLRWVARNVLALRR